MRRVSFIIIFVLIAFGNAFASEGELVCGVADGFPPYQFQDEEGRLGGLDVEIAMAVAKKMDVDLTFKQDSWDRVVTNLRLGRLDCVSGMEITQKRMQMFTFTKPYYTRKIVVFVPKKDTAIQSLEDLQYKVIAGDRHSYVEKRMEKLGLKRKIRIHQTKSKDKSFELLKSGEVVAVVAPKVVGFYLAQKYGVQVRVIEESDPGSKVAMAVEQGNTVLLERLEKALEELKKDGTLDIIFERWNCSTAE